MKKSVLKNFLQDKKGNFAVIFAITLVPLMAAASASGLCARAESGEISMSAMKIDRFNIWFISR